MALNTSTVAVGAGGGAILHAVPQPKIPDRAWVEWSIALVSVTLGSFGVVVFSHYELLSRLFPADATQVPAGVVHPKVGTVRLRPSKSIFWRDLVEPKGKASEGHVVMFGDTVHTGADSTAELALADGSSAEILPNSLVVIRPAPAREEGGTRFGDWFKQAVQGSLGAGRADFKVAQGGLRVKVSKSAPAAPVVVNGTEIKVQPKEEGGSVQVELASDSAASSSLKVSSDFASAVELKPMQAGAKVQTQVLDSAHPVSVALPERKSLGADFAKLLAPSEGQAFPAAPGMPVQFWYELDGSTDAKDLRLSIEVTGAESHRAKVSGAKGDSVAFELRPGQYRWRMAAERGVDESVSTNWVSFTVTEPVRQPTKPVVTSEAIPVAAPPPALPAATTQVAPEVKPAPAVAPVAAAPAPAKLSKADIAKAFQEELPTLDLEPVAPNTRLKDVRGFSAVEVELGWKPIAQATQYQVLLYDQDGDLVKQAILDRPPLRFKIQKLTSRNFSYQLKARLKSGKVVGSERVGFKIELSPPMPRNPEVNSKVSSAVPTLITWERTSLAESYQLEIARDAEFKSPVYRGGKQKANFYQMKLPGVGKYYWRVRSSYPAGDSAWSSASSFSVE